MEYLKLLIEAASAVQLVRDHTDDDDLQEIMERLRKKIHAEVDDMIDDGDW